ncbi:MAG: hypothetical protein B7Z12_05450 [Caulobacter vibrioides]|uniref:Uncharacterized protein n=1 Tax=Caulobacter vibrioides TaxID=155892 RepID=A0A258DAS2_CAUVI|nr:MAG: hypothetical protein B7Z12_05450 [Caulobacter vibrioides]
MKLAPQTGDAGKATPRQKAQPCGKERLDAPSHACHDRFRSFGARLVRKTMIVLMERPFAG